MVQTPLGEFTDNSVNRIRILARREAAQLSLLLKYLKFHKTDHFFDIGANVGAYAIMASEAGVPEVFAFEAAPSSFAELELNVQLRNAAVICQQLALSDREGSVDFVDAGPLSGVSRIAATTDNSANYPLIKVAARRLDDCFQICNTEFFAKIDVEGHERHVLNGGREFFHANKGVIQVELLTADSLTMVERFMKDLDYVWALNIHNDHYFISNSKLAERELLRDIAFSTISSVIDDYLEMTAFAGKCAKLIRQAEIPLPVGFPTPRIES
jgi:FkbM family methyltransferase